MTVGFMRWQQRRRDPGRPWYAVATGSDVIAPLLCKEFTLFRGELATTALQVEHQQMIIEPTYCARCRVRMR
ncbi:hypothetical protein [Bradyrhizobium sp. AZCC 2289]|uniref:hypothetical protein n=1 Tax=Bradyrhizobium sp. AZCC 2289 TaxID=3117026 RepID=UPI002FF2D442